MKKNIYFQNTFHYIFMTSIIFSGMSCRRNGEKLSSGQKPPVVNECQEQSENAVIEDGEVVIPREDQFLNIAGSGNIEELSNYLTSNFDLYQTDELGRNALMLASENGHLIVAYRLLVHESALSFTNSVSLKNQTDSLGFRAIHYAQKGLISDEGIERALIFLLKNDSGTISPKIFSPFFIKTLIDGDHDSDQSKLETLLKLGVDPNTSDETIQGDPIPPIFLTLGVRVNEAGTGLNFDLNPKFSFAQLLVKYGTDLTKTVELRRRSYTPLSLFNRVSRKLPNEDQAAWNQLLEGTQ